LEKATEDDEVEGVGKMMRVRCPYCGQPFEVEDIHRPVHCPHCGAVITFPAPDFQPFVLFTPGEQSGERG